MCDAQRLEAARRGPPGCRRCRSHARHGRCAGPARSLGSQLHGAVDVAQRPHRVGAAAGDQIGLAAGLAHLLGHGLHRGVHVATARTVPDLGAVEPVEQDVAVVLVVGILGVDAMLEQDDAAHAELGRDGGGLAAVIGLDGALGDHRVGALGLGVGHQELELAGLVAAGAEAGAVVALDPELRAAQQLRARFSIGSSGVGRWAKWSRGKRARCMGRSS